MPTPSLGARLRLSPPGLERAYWRDNAAALASRDLLLVLGFSVPSSIAVAFAVRQQHDKFEQPARVYVQLFVPWALMWCTWLACMHHHGFYRRRRVALVTAFRVFDVAANYFRCTSLAPLMGDMGIVPSSPTATVVLKMVFCSLAPWHAFLSLGLFLPYTTSVLIEWLVAATQWQTGLGLALIQWCNQPQHLAVLRSLNARWKGLLRGSMALHIPPHARLRGRSTDAGLAWTLMLVTPVAVCMYGLYMVQWWLLRLWLQAKLRQLQRRRREARARGRGGGAALDVLLLPDCSDDDAAGGGGGSGGSERGRAGRRASSSPPGLYVSEEQLLALHSSPAAALLLEPLERSAGPLRARLGPAVAAVCAHAVALGAICQVSLVVSELLVLQGLPRVLPSHRFELFFPIAGLGWYHTPQGQLPANFEALVAGLAHGSA